MTLDPDVIGLWLGAMVLAAILAWQWNRGQLAPSTAAGSTRDVRHAG